MRCPSFTSVGGEKEEFASGHFVLRTGNFASQGTLHPVGAARLRNIGEPDIATPRLRRFETPPLR